MTNMVLDTIAARRSHRAYTNEQISEDQLHALLAAALAAPTGVNRQAMHLSVVQNQSLLDEINLAAHEGAKAIPNASPRFLNDDFHVFYHAPTVIFLSGEASGNGYPVDCGIAVQTIALAAQSMGLGSVILGLPALAFDTPAREHLMTRLHFPDGYRFVIAIAVGHASDDKQAHPIKEGRVTIVR